MDFWKIFPEKEELLKWYEEHGDGQVRLVNAHMHTPYSFSAFTDIPQALNMAVNENVKVAGINDFYTTDFTKTLLFISDGSYLADIADKQHLSGSQWGMMNETGSYPGQAWLWLYSFWYQIPPFNTSENAD